MNSVMAVDLRYSAEFGRFGANYVKKVGDRPILSAVKCSLDNVILAVYDLWRYCQGFLRPFSLKEGGRRCQKR